MLRQPPAVSLRQLLVQVRSPRFLLQAVVLIALLIVWYFVGASIWNVPIINGVTQYDLIWPLQAGRMLLSGGDPYSSTYAQMMSGNPNDIVYPYPLASLWLTLPLLPLPEFARRRGVGFALDVGAAEPELSLRDRRATLVLVAATAVLPEHCIHY